MGGKNPQRSLETSVPCPDSALSFAALSRYHLLLFFSLMQAEHPFSDSLRSLALGINYTGDLKGKKNSSRTLALGVNLHWRFVFKNSNYNL